MLKSLAEIKSAHKGYWFSPETMRFWQTKVSEKVYPTASGTYFVSSDLTFDDRLAWSVRFCDLSGKISTVEPFQGFCCECAHREAARLASLVA